jgi:Mg2+/Co2+ transporter CorB
MMALNYYRLRHLARKGNLNAQRIIQLLKRPDRLLGMILIGNTFANILASAVATVIAAHYFGSVGVFVTTILLTLIILIFSEAAPKTLAALHPQAVAFFVLRPLRISLRLLYPLVVLVNVISNAFLRIFGVKVGRRVMEALSAEELRTIVHEASGRIATSYQQMLLRVLNLGQMTVEDVMVPRNQIHGIDITVEWDTIWHALTTSGHSYLPIYRESIDQVLGILNVKNIIRLLPKQKITKDKLMALAEEVYFIPEVTLLNDQLVNFQDEHKTMALVVDEYGDIQGLIALHDIVEEIVGEITANVEDSTQWVRKQADGSYLVDGRIAVRDLNRMTDWRLPINDAKTLSGAVVEYLEMIPMAGIALRLAGYPMEIVKMNGNTAQLIRVWPDQWKDTALEKYQD